MSGALFFYIYYMVLYLYHVFIIIYIYICWLVSSVVSVVGHSRCLTCGIVWERNTAAASIPATEEYKCGVNQEKNVVGRSVVPNSTKGRKWKPSLAVNEAALRHVMIVGNVQVGWGGLGLGSGKPLWNKMVLKIKESWFCNRYIGRRRYWGVHR